ncbi:MAG: EamA family transporter [Thermomicrobiales bacterium]
MLAALGFIGVYVVLVGVASFLEQPLAQKLDAFRLGAALRLGALIMAVAALLAGRGPAIPSLEPVLAGIGIGLILGFGSVFYCLALARLRAWLAASVANGYVAATVLLGVVVLGEHLTWFVIAGLTLTLTGVVALSWQKPAEAGSHSLRRSLAAAWPLGVYIVLVGVGVFLQKPALRGLTALQLNALTALGMAMVALAAVGVRDRRIPTGPAALATAGVGILLGLGGVGYYLALERLPVSVAATLANTSVLVTAALAILVRHQAVTRRQIVGAAATLAGVCLLTISQRRWRPHAAALGRQACAAH